MWWRCACTHRVDVLLLCALHCCRSARGADLPWQCMSCLFVGLIGHDHLCDLTSTPSTGALPAHLREALGRLRGVAPRRRGARVLQAACRGAAAVRMAGAAVIRRTHIHVMAQGAACFCAGPAPGCAVRMLVLRAGAGPSLCVALRPQAGQAGVAGPAGHDASGAVRL